MEDGVLIGWRSGRCGRRGADGRAPCARGRAGVWIVQRCARHPWRGGGGGCDDGGRRSSVVGEAADPVNSFDVAGIEGDRAEEGGGGGDGWCREPERVAIYTGGRLAEPPPPASLCLPRS